MAKNEQSQEQRVSVKDSLTPCERIGCRWFHGEAPDGGHAQAFLQQDPLHYSKVDILTFQGQVTRVLCPYLQEGKCTSSNKPEGREHCYIAKSRT